MSSISPVSPPRAWAEIDLAALRWNLAVAREACGMDVMAVVKAGAYGHGLEEIARAFAAEGVAFLGVANVGEARRIRNAGVETTPFSPDLRSGHRLFQRPSPKKQFPSNHARNSICFYHS